MGYITINYRDHINKPSKRVEQFILNLPYDVQRVETAYNYAKEVLGSRFLKAECFIKKNPEFAARYARHVMKGPWTAAERNIKKQMSSFYYYAKYVKRNLPGSERIVQDAFKKKDGVYKDGVYYAFLYCIYIRKKRWRLFEQLIEKAYADNNVYSFYQDQAVRYTKRYIKGRWEAIEEKVMEDRVELISKYASILSPSEKQEFHNKILIKLMMMPANESMHDYYHSGLKRYAKKTNLAASV